MKKFIKATLLFTLIISILASSGCGDKRKGELTRELATEILNQHLAAQSLSELEFSDGGIERAEQDGIIQKQDGYPPNYCFTNMGLKMVDTVIRQNYILGKWVNEVPRFGINPGISEQVSEVNGIAEGPTPNIKVVEYVTNFQFPPKMKPMTRYIFSGRKKTSVFQKYDDGWRFAQ